MGGCLYMQECAIMVLTSRALQVKSHQKEVNGPKFAVKWMKRSEASFNLTEARALWASKHENIVQMLAAVVEDGYVVGIMMEQCECSLADKVEKYTLGEGPQITIALQLARGLTVLHDSGIVHADFKSNNVLLQPAASGGYTTKICDLGCAQNIGRGAPRTETRGFRGNAVGDVAAQSVAADTYGLRPLIF